MRANQTALKLIRLGHIRVRVPLFFTGQLLVDPKNCLFDRRAKDSFLFDSILDTKNIEDVETHFLAIAKIRYEENKTVVEPDR